MPDLPTAQDYAARRDLTPEAWPLVRRVAARMILVRRYWERGTGWCPVAPHELLDDLEIPVPQQVTILATANLLVQERWGVRYKQRGQAKYTHGRG